MSWEVVCRLTNTLPTLRPLYSLLQAEVTAASIATLLARFLIAVRTCFWSLLTQCLEQAQDVWLDLQASSQKESGICVIIGVAN